VTHTAQYATLLRPMDYALPSCSQMVLGLQALSDFPFKLHGKDEKQQKTDKKSSSDIGVIGQLVRFSQ